MLGQVPPTAFDLNFSLFGIPVRVHPGFWLVAALLGWAPGRLDLVLVWIGCLFVSILVHELGHALTAKRFGWPPEIVLYHFGGLAMFQPTWRYTTGRSILVSFAGPGAGFLLLGLTVALLFVPGLDLTFAGRAGEPTLADHAIWYLIWINLVWGAVNLLPVLPLDGGQICRDVCVSLRPRDGMEWALKISMLISGGVAFFFLVNRDWLGLYPGLLFGFLCFQNFQTYQSHRSGYW